MRTSDDLTEIAPALVAAQGEFEAVEKSANNPFFKSKYADLPSIVKAATPILHKNGLAVTSFVGFEDGQDVLTTRIIHSSGQWMEDTMRLFLVKHDPQGQGSALTYARRYSYSAVLGIVTEVDDDGNAASQPTQAPQTTQRRSAPKVEATTGEIKASDTDLASAKQLAMMGSLFNQKGLGDDHGVRVAYAVAVIGRTVESSKELTKREASQVIEALMAEADGD